MGEMDGRVLGEMTGNGGGAIGGVEMWKQCTRNSLKFMRVTLAKTTSKGGYTT